MNGILVRIGVDSVYGEWNAPADPETGEFVYLPIPEKNPTKFHPKCARSYDEFRCPLTEFAARRGLDLERDLRFPNGLFKRDVHLDPDFGILTYGNRANSKSAAIRKLRNGDLVVFFAGMRSTRSSDKQLIYGLVGILVVDEVVDVPTIPQARWAENAHTRKINHDPNDVVIRGKRHESGRLSRFISIGEYRNRAYRVRRDILDEWGNLSVNDGYIQRSAVPPRFCDAVRFYRWFRSQKRELVQRNN